MIIRSRNVIEAALNSTTMTEAAKKCGLGLTTFKNYAIKLGVYKPNQGNPFLLKKVFSGEVNWMSSSRLREKLFESGLKTRKCETCGRVTWLKKKLPLQLHHRNGNRLDNRLSNLQILCPNCHAQTDTYCGKNKGNYKGK